MSTWASGDSLNSRNLNFKSGQALALYNILNYSGSSDGTTDNVSAISSAAAVVKGGTAGGFVYLPPGSAYSSSDLTAGDALQYLDASREFQGRNIVRLLKIADITNFIASQHAENLHVTAEAVGSTATVSTARLDGMFTIASVGRQTAPAASDGSGIDRVIASGIYMEHRSAVSISQVWGAEVAGTVYGSGTVGTVKGMECIAQISKPDTGNASSLSGAGIIQTGYGVVGVVRILSGATGTMATGVGVLAQARHESDSRISDFQGIDITLQNVGTGGVERLKGLDFTTTFTSSGQIEEVKLIRIPNLSAPTGTIATAFGLQVDEQTRATTNRTAWVRGALHVERNKAIVYDSASTVWDSTSSRARSLWSTPALALEFYASDATHPTLSVLSRHISIRSNPPAAGDASGVAGEVAWGMASGTTFFYVCLSANSWHRVALDPF